MGACYVYLISGLKKHSSFVGSYHKITRVATCGDAMGIPSSCVVGKKEILGKRLINCLSSTINGEVVPAVARYGYEEGLPEEFRAACSALKAK